MKRFFDITFSLTVLLLASPVFLFLSLAILYNFGWPLFFYQDRPGKNGKLFRMMKFRTMSDARDAAGNLLADQIRLTGFGRLVRSTSLDELPGLLNVLKGEMSIVGPRPLLQQYLPLYSPEQARRHDVLPGLTGWAQVNGRNNVEWPTRFALDVWYVENQSLLLDLKILFMTVLKVIKRDGINPQGKVEMEFFQGNIKQ
jgi:lipopolysaccharide/colanic/teichoic acid biosynthesis glycosyltransferase